MMKVHVIDLAGNAFGVEVDGKAKIIEAKHKIQTQQGYEVAPQELQLVLDGEILHDEDDLSDTSLQQGDTLTLAIVKSFGLRLTELLSEKIDDDTQFWHGKHKFALRSEPLQDEVEKIEVSVGHFEDQGWGGCQARLFIYLHDPSDKDRQVATMKVFGPLRTTHYDDAKHGSSPSCTIGREEAVVALAKPGMVYKLRYQNGGGGGHSITVRGWSCKIFPQQRNTDKVTTKLSGSVCLRNTSRLGPDKTTGKWQLEEPPYPSLEEPPHPPSEETPCFSKVEDVTLKVGNQQGSMEQEHKEACTVL